LRAQSAGATLSGTITALAGTPVANAKISAKNSATGQSSEALTGTDGTYSLTNLAPGDYEVSVSAPNYVTKASKVTLAAGGAETLNAALVALPSSLEEPSLSDLGFTPSVTKGSAQEQALLNRRSHMLQVHQRLGLITLAPLIASVVTSSGAKTRRRMNGTLSGSASGRDLHAALGSATVALYFSSAYFAIRAPKIHGTETRGPIRLHKALAWIHGPGMILTPVLGAIAFSQESRGERPHGIAKYHSDVAWVTVGAYTAAILSVSIKF
jgi:Carboxypeptidase regulatory-like domain